MKKCTKERKKNSKSIWQYMQDNSIREGKVRKKLQEV